MGAKPSIPVFNTLDRNWVYLGFYDGRGGGVGTGLGLGCLVGRLCGGRGANEADARGGVGRCGFNGAVYQDKINELQNRRVGKFRSFNFPK